MPNVYHISFPSSPEPGATHSQYGRTWEYVLAPAGSPVPGMWKNADGCSSDDDGIGYCWTVESVKNYLGIEGDDPVVDAKIQGAMTVVQTAMERYCNRHFGYMDTYQEHVYETKGDGWQVHLWPIKSAVLVNGDVLEEFYTDNQTGIIFFPGYSWKRPSLLQFAGGYEPCEWPADLMAVMLGSIGAVYQTLQDGGVTDSAISKITIPDVGTITYDNSTNGEIGSGGAFIGGVIPMHWQSTLDFYRLHEC